MTREEYVFRISSLTQELTGLAAEYFSTQRDPYEVAGERFNQAVAAFEQDLSTRTAELEARAESGCHLPKKKLPPAWMERRPEPR